MSYIIQLFQDIHGTLNFNNVIQMRAFDKKECKKICDLLNINMKDLYYNKAGLFNKIFYYNGIYYTEVYSSEQIKFYQEQNESEILKKSIQRGIKYFDSLVVEEKFEELFNSVDKKVLIKTYIELYNRIPDNKKWEAFVNLYIRCETAFDTIPQALLDDLINNMTKLSKKIDKRLFDLRKRTKTVLHLNYNNSFKVYHGMNTDYNPNDEMSWTLSYKTAKFFANRFDTKGKVVDKKITMNEVIDFLDQRGEQEVLLRVKK